MGMSASQAFGQMAPTRQIVPVPFNDNPTVTAEVSIDGKELRIGSTVGICFKASSDGYASLWNISTRSEVTRIFPNAFLAGGAATYKVDGGRRYCAGVGGDPFRFRVDGPPGIEDLYLLWTARPDLQPAGQSFATPQALIAGIQQLGRASTAEWATTKITYDIVPASGAAPADVPVQGSAGGTVMPPSPMPTPGPQSGTPRVLVLAMGANVDRLTKTNQDARMFANAAAQLFKVSAANVRLVENARKADFKAGMQWAYDNARAGDFIFIYFSGHGGRFHSETSDDGWDEYMVPYDFEFSQDPHNLVFSQQFATWINEMPTKNVIATIDTCFSAGVFRSLEADVLGARSKSYNRLNDGEVALAFQAERQPQTRAMGGHDRIKANGGADGRRPTGSVGPRRSAGRRVHRHVGQRDDGGEERVPGRRIPAGHRRHPAQHPRAPAPRGGGRHRVGRARHLPLTS